MRISDWSSDVCSSDLLDHGQDARYTGAMGMVVYLFALALIGAVMPLAYDQVATLLGRLWDWWNGIGGDGQGVVIAGLLAFVGVPWTLRENARRQREMVEQAAALQREALLQKFDNERRLAGVRAAVLMRADAVARPFPKRRGSGAGQRG